MDSLCRSGKYKLGKIIGLEIRSSIPMHYTELKLIHNLPDGYLRFFVVNSETRAHVVVGVTEAQVARRPVQARGQAASPLYSESFTKRTGKAEGGAPFET
jgi:hypothetical protein